MAYAGEYTRTYTIDTVSNRLLSTTVGADTYTYAHDVRGNMTEMPQLDIMNWSRSNELDRIEKGTMKGYYQYSGGQRLRKHVDKDSIYEERIYLGSFELYRKFDSAGALTIERQTVHISDDTGRIAMHEQLLYESQPGEEDFADELTRYIYSNHLQSASLELDDQAEIISYEEYHPYGTTAYQAMNALIRATAKRYRYTGKERDEESGLYYHGARYYIPWLCRWSASDPINSENYNLQKGYGLEKNRERHFLELTASNYEYCYDNPLMFSDSDGEQAVPNFNPYPLLEQEWNRMITTVERTTTKIVDKSFKPALIAVAFKKTPELLVNTILGREMSEDRKQEIFDTDFEASVGILLYEFATGTSPNEGVRDFYYDQNKPNSFANKIVEGYIFSDTISGLYKNVKYHFYNSNLNWNTVKNIPEKKYQYDIEFSPDQTGFRVSKSMQRHLLSNAAQFFLGGASGFVKPTADDKADVIIVNTSSRSSLLLHLANDDYNIGELSNITQRIHFSIINLDKTQTSEYKSDIIEEYKFKTQWIRKAIDLVD